MNADVPVDAHPSWNDVAPLRFTLTANEGSAGSKAPPLAGVMRLIWGIVAALYLFLGLLRMIHHRGDAVTVALEIASFAVAATLAVGFGTFIRPRHVRPGNYALRFTSDAVVVEQPKPAVIAWRRVMYVEDIDGVIYIIVRRHARLAIPKRIFDDDGALFWKRLEDQLIGKRNLHRVRRSSLILNTARS